MKKSLSTILVFLNVLVSPWLGCYADSGSNITTKATISYVENKKNNRTGIGEKTVVSIKDVSPTDYIHSRDNNTIDIVLKNGETLKIAVDSDVRISIPKLKEQLKKESAKFEKKIEKRKTSKNETLEETKSESKTTENKNSFYSKIKDFSYTAMLKFLFATINVLPHYLMVKYL